MPLMALQTSRTRGVFRRRGRRDFRQGSASLRRGGEGRLSICIDEDAGDSLCQVLEGGVPEGSGVLLGKRGIVGPPPAERGIVANRPPEFLEREAEGPKRSTVSRAQAMLKSDADDE